MRILIGALTYPLPNGVTVSINTSVDGLIKNGFKVKIISPDYGGAKIRKEHNPIPSSIIVKGAMSVIGKEERTFGVNASKHLKEIIKEFNPDIYWLHTLSLTQNAFEKQMMKSKNKKILTYHTMVEEYGKIYAGQVGSITMQKRSKKVCNKMDAIIAPTNFMKKKLREYGVTKPIHVIPTGIEIPKTSFKKNEICKRFKISPKNNILLYTGRISEEKNVKILLEMMKNLKDKKLKSVLLIIGPGDIQKMKEEAINLNVQDKIIFTGPLLNSEVKKIYGSCDVFVFPSVTEVQGLVVGEAMASGIPVVAMKSKIQEEIYPENVAIIANHPSEFPEKVIEIINNQRKRKDLTKKAKEFVSNNFSKELMIKKQIELFGKF